MSVIRRYENELSAKVKQKDMFELLKDWVTNDFKKPENSKFSEHLIKSGIYAAKTDTGYVSVRTIHVGNTVSPYEDNYLFDTKIVYENRNLFINEKGYLLYDKDNNNWNCSIKTEVMPNDQTQEINSDGFDFTPSFLKFCRKYKLLGTNLGFRITNRPVRLRWEDFDEVRHLLNRDALFYKPITLLRIQDDNNLKQAIDGLCVDTAVWVDDDPDLFEDLKEELDEDSIPSDNSITYYPPFGKNKTYSLKELKENEDLTNIISDIKNRVNIYHVENCILQHDYEEGVHARSSAELEYYKSIIDTLKNENAGLKKDIGELKLLSKQKVTVPVTKVAKTKKTVTISKEPLVFNGELNELYDGEIKDMILASLEEYRSKYVQDKTRRADVLDSVLTANSSSGICNKKAQDISTALKNYDGASPKNIATLEKLGFKVKSKSNHLKIQWYDPKYTYSIATTPSDVNAAENIVHNIIKMFL